MSRLFLRDRNDILRSVLDKSQFQMKHTRIKRDPPVATCAATCQFLGHCSSIAGFVAAEWVFGTKQRALRCVHRSFSTFLERKIVFPTSLLCLLMQRWCRRKYMGNRHKEQQDRRDRFVSRFSWCAIYVQQIPSCIDRKDTLFFSCMKWFLPFRVHDWLHTAWICTWTRIPNLFLQQ